MYGKRVGRSTWGTEADVGEQDMQEKENESSMTNHVSPLMPGDRLLLSGSLTALPESNWAVVDLIQPDTSAVSEATFQVSLMWKVGYRITIISSGCTITEQLGIVFVDDWGHDFANEILAVNRITHS